MKLPLFAALLAASLACAPAANAKLSKAEAAMARTVAAEQDRSVALLERLVNQNSGPLNLEGVEKVGTMMRAELEPLGFEGTWTPMPATESAGHLTEVHKAREGGKRLVLRSEAH